MNTIYSVGKTLHNGCTIFIETATDYNTLVCKLSYRYFALSETLFEGDDIGTLIICFTNSHPYLSLLCVCVLVKVGRTTKLIISLLL